MIKYSNKFITNCETVMLACDPLVSAVYFAPNQIRTCCKRFHVDGAVKGDAVLLDTKDLGEDPVGEILNAKSRLLQEINSPDFSKSHQCHGCPWLKKYEEDISLNLSLSQISFEMHSVCNMRCTYCSDVYYGGLNPDYNVDSLLASLKQYLSTLSFSAPTIVFGGGEPVIFKDFKKILDFSVDVEPSQFRIFTNSVVFSQEIKNYIDQDKIYVTTSIDAGCEDTFFKIRGLNAYHRVISNLTKYASCNPKNVTIKYIFTEDNSGLNEVEGFLAAISEAKLINCSFQISSDFKFDSLSSEQIKSISAMRSGLLDLNITDIYVDDHLAPRLISASTDSATSNVNSTKLQPYVVWGCGDHARRIFERIGVSNVQYFVDSSIDSPQEFMACPAYNPSSLSTSKTPPRVFIASTQSYPEIKKQLKAICNDFYIIDTPF